MIFSRKILIEEYVIEILDSGPQTGPALFERVLNFHGIATKQAVYKALRKLLQDEVINKQGVYYSLNRVWLQKIKHFSNRHIIKPESVDITNILNFEDGDSVIYTFKNPFLLDITWGHLYDILYEANPTEHVMLNYHPHEWLILSRTETEKFWLGRFSKDRKMMCFTVGGTSNLDKKFQKEYSSDYIKINLGENYGLRPNQYLSVQDDYIFEVTTDQRFEKCVHDFFEACIDAQNVNQKQIVEISKLKYRSKLKLSKNKKKADMWRKKFGKDYYIPKPYYLFNETK